MEGELLSLGTVYFEYGEADYIRAMSIPRATYQKLLYDAAIDLGVQVHLSSRIKHLDENTPSVTLTTGEVITGDIIVGADGLSPSRMANI